MVGVVGPDEPKWVTFMFVPARARRTASTIVEAPRTSSAPLDELVERGILTFRSLRKARRGRPAKVCEATELSSPHCVNPPIDRVWSQGRRTRSHGERSTIRESPRQG